MSSQIVEADQRPARLDQGRGRARARSSGARRRRRSWAAGSCGRSPGPAPSPTTASELWTAASSSANPTRATMPATPAASSSSARRAGAQGSAASATDPRPDSRRCACSGNTTTPAPAPHARGRSTRRSSAALPSMSPTVVLTWASAMRSLAGDASILELSRPPETRDLVQGLSGYEREGRRDHRRRRGASRPAWRRPRRRTPRTGTRRRSWPRREALLDRTARPPGSRPRSSPSSSAELAAVDALSSRARTAWTARAILARPDDGLCRPLRRRVHGRTSRPSRRHCSAELLRPLGELDARRPEPRRLERNRTTVDGVPDFVEETLASADDSFAVENTTLGWTEPLTDGARGGGGRRAHRRVPDRH